MDDGVMHIKWDEFEGQLCLRFAPGGFDNVVAEFSKLLQGSVSQYNIKRDFKI